MLLLALWAKRSAETLVKLQPLDNLHERPFLNFGGCTISPLPACQAIIVGAQHHIPIGCLSMAMSGGMSPVKITGALVVDLAETLAALVLAQAVRKGAPLTVFLTNAVMLAELGCPEAALLSRALPKCATSMMCPVSSEVPRQILKLPISKPAMKNLDRDDVNVSRR